MMMMNALQTLLLLLLAAAAASTAATGVAAAAAPACGSDCQRVWSEPNFAVCLRDIRHKGRVVLPEDDEYEDARKWVGRPQEGAVLQLCRGSSVRLPPLVPHPP